MFNENKVVPMDLDESKVLHNSSSVVSSDNLSKLSLDELDAVSAGARFQGSNTFNSTPCGYGWNDDCNHNPRPTTGT